MKRQPLCSSCACRPFPASPPCATCNLFSCMAAQPLPWEEGAALLRPLPPPAAAAKPTTCPAPPTACLVAAELPLALQQPEVWLRHNAVRVALHGADGACGCEAGRGLRGEGGGPHVGRRRRRQRAAYGAAPLLLMKAHSPCACSIGSQSQSQATRSGAASNSNLHGWRRRRQRRRRRWQRRRRRWQRRAGSAEHRAEIGSRARACSSALDPRGPRSAGSARPPDCSAVALARVRDGGGLHGDADGLERWAGMTLCTARCRRCARCRCSRQVATASHHEWWAFLAA